jgi:hypothetical protein
MGHNRGWEEAASMFSGASVELKTCNAALLETAGKSWNEVVIIYYYVSFQKEKYLIFNREKICI